MTILMRLFGWWKWLLAGIAAVIAWFFRWRSLSNKRRAERAEEALRYHKARQIQQDEVAETLDEARARQKKRREELEERIRQRKRKDLGSW